MVINTRAAIESLYNGICDVWEYRLVSLPNKASAYKEVKVHEKIPCRLSHVSNSPSNRTETVNAVDEDIKLFISPDISIKSGSKIVVTWYSETKEYTNTGEPARYSNHQEILLTKFEGWC